MNNIFIHQKKNYFPLVIPYDSIQEKKEIKIHKIIFEPSLKNLKFLINLKLILNQQNIMLSFNFELFSDNNNIKDKNYEIISTNDNNYIIIFKLSIIEGYIELSEFNLININNRRRNNNRNRIIYDYVFDVDVLINNTVYGHFDESNFPNAIIKFSIIPCEFLKIYITSSLYQSIEIDSNNEQKYTGLITIKKPNSFPIEFTEEDFFNEYTIGNNSFFLITDEKNNLIDINNIYLFYSLI